ncbi:hypothetical protein [Streptomyces sp. SYSU K21746]
MIRPGWICSTNSPPARRRSTVCSTSSVMTGGRPPCLPLRAAVSSPSGVDSRMFSRPVCAITAKIREQQPAGATLVVHTLQGAGEHVQDQAVGGQVVGERGEFGRVAAEPLHLIDGEDDPAMRGMGLDLAGHGERGRELRADRIRVLIFSLKIFSRGMPCLLSASSWQSSSWPVSSSVRTDADVGAWGVRVDRSRRAECRAARAAPVHGSAGVGTRSSFARRGTLSANLRTMQVAEGGATCF